jgi:diphthine-ammonia ligase
MCGILACANANPAFIEQGLRLQQHRGSDGYGYYDTKELVYNTPFYSTKKTILAHTLHAIVSKVLQPIQLNQTIITANCEIYNYKELAKTHNIRLKDTDNDATVLATLIDQTPLKKLPQALEQIQGPYAWVALKKNTLIACRDSMGEKPLWYSFTNKKELYIASEAKVLRSFGLDPQELHPRHILIYNCKTKSFKTKQRAFFKVQVAQMTLDQAVETTYTKIYEAVKKMIPQQKVGILFSGGVDSAVLAMMLRRLKVPFQAYVAGTADSEDMHWAIRAAKELDIPLTPVILDQQQIQEDLSTIVNCVESSNVTKITVAIPFFYCTKQAKKDGCKVLFSGLGSEELFAGYERHTHSLDVNKECVSGLLKQFEKDLYRDDTITMYHTIEIRLPYLDIPLIKHALTIPSAFKLHEKAKKYVLRLVGKKLNIPDSIAFRPKKAAQYGSSSDKILEKITKGVGKSAYLNKLWPHKNQRIALLLSGGKDSLYAALVQARQHYPVCCAITIMSESDESYMFHTPNIQHTILQAQALGVAHIIEYTKGEKEAELKQLYQAMLKAKELGAQAIVVGALASTYQRDRVDALCEKAGLKVFAPLWHKTPHKELEEVINNDMKVILVRTASDGLGPELLGKPLTKADVKHIIALSEKFRFNAAGEGGEFESFVLDCPLFTHELVIDKHHITSDKLVHTYYIDKAHLVQKNLKKK